MFCIFSRKKSLGSVLFSRDGRITANIHISFFWPKAMGDEGLVFLVVPKSQNCSVCKPGKLKTVTFLYFSSPLPLAMGTTWVKSISCEVFPKPLSRNASLNMLPYDKDF